MNPQNKMRQIKIEKVTLNIGVGQPGENLEKAMKLLNKITSMKPIQTKTMKRIPTWGLRPNLAIGCKVTIRGKKAEELLSRLLKAIDNKLDSKKFDDTGNFSFGIKEYIDIPSVNYDIDIGIIGLETAVTLERAGYRVKKRKIKRSGIPSRHLITKEEAVDFIRNKFNVNILEEGEAAS
ncbi:50S ribosomal protein L5 [Candidatus Woesearchaeota archaeon]|nr:50S ribosomal protein L5 [Candidatus Woesearchaeota archaeon]